MKNSSKFLFVLSVLFFMISCKEEGPIIILEAAQVPLVDTSYISSTPIASSPQNILFEEFSGVRCSNCPLGNEETHNLVIAHGDRIVPITIHSDFLASPYGENPDLRTEDANLIANTLGPVGVKPSCFINRKEINNGSRLIDAPTSWSGLVDVELSNTSIVNIVLEIIEADVAERTFKYRATLEYSGDATGHSLGFFLTESEIIAEQLELVQHILDYEHEFVLRKSITPIIGEPITTDLIANTVIIKEFEIDLDGDDYNPSADWVINHMDLVAFVRQSNDDIVQAAKIKIIQ